MDHNTRTLRYNLMINELDLSPTQYKSVKTRINLIAKALNIAYEDLLDQAIILYEQANTNRKES